MFCFKVFIRFQFPTCKINPFNSELFELESELGDQSATKYTLK